MSLSFIFDVFNLTNAGTKSSFVSRHALSPLVQAKAMCLPLICLKITREVGGHRDTIIAPAPGRPLFRETIERMMTAKSQRDVDLYLLTGPGQT